MRNVYEAWKQRAKEKQGDSADMLLYCMLRAIKAKSNDKPSVLTGLIYKCFTPITNARKLANGHTAWQGVHNAIHRLAVYGDTSPKTAEEDTKSLYACMETDEERDQYRQLLFSLLHGKIKLNDRRLVCFIIRQDMPRPRLILHTTQVAMNLATRPVIRAASAKTTARQLRKAKIRAEVQKRTGRWIAIRPRTRSFSLDGINLLLLGANDGADLQAKVSQIVARRVTIIDTGDADVVCTMPIRASVIHRRKLLEGILPLDLTR